MYFLLLKHFAHLSFQLPDSFVLDFDLQISQSAFYSILFGINLDYSAKYLLAGLKIENKRDSIKKTIQ